MKKLLHTPLYYYDLLHSSSIDIQTCKSVCLALGPYRNLTTLTASLFFLHPHCQVLNHAGLRIFSRREVDFFTDFSRKKMDRFLQYAIRLSARGKRGDYGGSIIHSHAFEEKHPMKDAFLKSGGNRLKKEIKCLFWKESLRTSNLIRQKNVDLGKIFQSEKRLRFLLPIRNPLDCARSNLRTGHVDLFENVSKNSSMQEIIQAVLDEIYWVKTLHTYYPGRFFYFFEHQLSREILERIAAFLEIEPADQWLDNAASTLTIKPGYEHQEKYIIFYRDYVNTKFKRFPDMTSALLKFTDT